MSKNTTQTPKTTKVKEPKVSRVQQSGLVGLRELRENTEKYIKATKKGKSFTVLRRSKPIFKIVPVDEWGDEGVWETIIDFREINPKGVPAKDVLKALHKVNA